MKPLLPVLALLLPGLAFGQQPAQPQPAQPQPAQPQQQPIQAQPVPAAPQPPTLAELDKKIVDILRFMHDRGADMYNAGDAAGAVKVYQTALGTVTPFVTHHPVILKVIIDGLSESDKSDGDKAKAFRLHEIIEKVRADLRAEVKTLESNGKNPPGVNPIAPSGPKQGLSGVVSLKGEPLARVDLTLVSLNLPAPRVFTTKSDLNGNYSFATLPAAEYVVIVTGSGIPAKFHTTDSSGLRVSVKATGAVLNLELQ